MLPADVLQVDKEVRWPQHLAETVFRNRHKKKQQRGKEKEHIIVCINECCRWLSQFRDNKKTHHNHLTNAIKKKNLRKLPSHLKKYIKKTTSFTPKPIGFVNLLQHLPVSQSNNWMNLESGTQTTGRLSRQQTNKQTNSSGVKVKWLKFSMDFGAVRSQMPTVNRKTGRRCRVQNVQIVWWAFSFIMCKYLTHTPP